MNGAAGTQVHVDNHDHRRADRLGRLLPDMFAAVPSQVLIEAGRPGPLLRQGPSTT